jgi:hypothetical protein
MPTASWDVLASSAGTVVVRHRFNLGDRHVSLAVLVYAAEREDIVGGLRGALLTDDELSRPNEWASFADPFGDWHEDPCDDMTGHAGEVTSAHEGQDR